jgi:UDP-sugar transporter A1/2/3
MFSVLILKRKLRFEQWLSFVFLLVGIVLVQLASTEGGGGHLNPEENRLIGFSAAFGAALCSGFAGVYLEKIMKESQVSIWVRNAQLALLSVVIGLASCLAGTDSDLVWKKGFFFG